MYDVSGAKPGDLIERCIRVSYSGLDADVKLYAPDTIGALGQYLTLKIEQGTQAFTHDGVIVDQQNSNCRCRLGVHRSFRGSSMTTRVPLPGAEST